MIFLVLYQFMIVGAFSLLSLYVKGSMAGQSAIFGGLVYCIPYVVTSLYMNKPGANTAAKVMVRAYVTLAFKFVITAALFVFLFKYTKVHFITLFLGYILAFVVQCIMSFGFIKRN